MTTAADLGFIHSVVPGRDDRAPLVVLHGTGGDENDLLAFAHRIAPEATLISPRGKVSENGMARYFRRHPDGAWDLDDLRLRTAELIDFVTRARATYRFGKPILLGYSNGANVAWSMLLSSPDAFAGAILFRAMLPFDPRPLPDLAQKPILVLAGKNDELVPVERAGLLAALLGEAGGDVTYETLPSGHQLVPDDLKLAASWLASRR